MQRLYNDPANHNLYETRVVETQKNYKPSNEYFMSEKYQNKYRIPSARLQSWDYSSNAAYFITICTKNREHFFGEIVNDEMQLNEMGKLAEKYWMEIPEHFPFIELHNFVVMPNHVHGILAINKPVETLQCNVSVPPQCNVSAPSQCNVSTAMPPIPTNQGFPVETLQCNVSTTTTPIPTNPPQKNEQMSKISPKAHSISTVVRSYKSVVSTNIHKMHADFAWQTRFHDHIIRDSKSFERIQDYITNNPTNWKKDKFYT